MGMGAKIISRAIAAGMASNRNAVLLAEGTGCKGHVLGLAYDAWKRFPKRCFDMPICEDMQVGMAIGMALDNRSCIVIFQRCDFMWRAADQIVNHLLKWPGLYHVQLPVTLIAVEGDTPGQGPQHSGSFDLMPHEDLRTLADHIAKGRCPKYFQISKATL